MPEYIRNAFGRKPWEMTQQISHLFHSPESDNGLIFVFFLFSLSVKIQASLNPGELGVLSSAFSNFDESIG